MSPPSPLFTDLYELTMAAVYFERGMAAPATFSLYVRRLPRGWGFLLAAGLEEVLAFLESFRFSDEDLAFLESLGLFRRDFLDYLASLRFSGEVRALPEGTVFFPEEPVLEITAPIVEAQLVETFVLNAVHFSSLVASKAARCVLAAQGRAVVDFSARRAHGVDAALRVARASYLAGFSATSNTLAGRLYGIPVTGTMAHSFVESFPAEKEAFLAFARTFPEHTVLLLDTYEVSAAARKAVEVAGELAARGASLRGVRLDSGDLVALSRQVRRILDEAGLEGVKILASGGLDEHRIAALLEQGAPIDAFGVGTRLGVVADAPSLDAAYKLVLYDGRPVAKLAAGKRTLPGAKQVFRFLDDEGRLWRDVVALREEEVPGAAPLLQVVMEGGRRTGPAPSLTALRERARRELARLPDALRSIRAEGSCPVEVSPALVSLAREVEQEIGRREGLASHVVA